MIDRFGGFAERLLHRPGEAKVDNARPLGHQTAAGAAKPYRPAARGKMRADRRQIRKLTIAPRHHQSLRRLPELGDGLAGAGFSKQRLFGLGGILAKLQRQRGGENGEASSRPWLTETCILLTGGRGLRPPLVGQSTGCFSSAAR